MSAETMVDSRQELLSRHPANPLLNGAEWPYPVNSVFNAGAVTLASGETLLLCRVEERSGRSHLCTARSADGVADWRIDPRPTLEPDDELHREEHWGIEDPRIVRLEELGRYAVTYTGFARRGPLVCLALTDDFKTFDRFGAILPPENKDAALLPRKINGRWAMIHRPVPTMGRPSLWISYSPDLRHWGDHTLLFEPRHGPWWDANKIGLSPPPIETDRGWLVLYHGVKTITSVPLYRMGLALLDREDPRRCVCRSHEWIFTPDQPYERTGDVPNVAFSCGLTVDGDQLNLYYGAADTSMCLATGSISAMLAWLEEHRQ